MALKSSADLAMELIATEINVSLDNKEALNIRLEEACRSEVVAKLGIDTLSKKTDVAAQVKTEMMTLGPNNPIPVDPENNTTYTPEYTRILAAIADLKEQMVTTVNLLEAAKYKKTKLRTLSTYLAPQDKKKK